MTRYKVVRVFGFLLTAPGTVMVCLLHLGHSSLDYCATAMTVVLFYYSGAPVSIGALTHLGRICCSEMPRSVPVPGIMLFFFVAVVEEANTVAGKKLLLWNGASRMGDIGVAIEPGF